MLALSSGSGFGSTEMGEGIRRQLPDEAVGGGEQRRDAQIQDHRSLQAVKRDPSGCIDGVRDHPNQRQKDDDVAAALEPRAG